MRITGIIAEYNPFHNGHKYLLETARHQTNADYIIVIMNGNFMQRGIPAYWNKYQRAAMAVEQGADAVFELPVLYGTASAEYFAYGGVQLLNQLSGIQSLCFGCETERLSLLEEAARILLTEPPEYKQQLSTALTNGDSFPKARATAISHILTKAGCNKEELDQLLTLPNTILALEYLKALRRTKSHIQPVPCLRTDQGYHTESMQAFYSSATAIRKEYEAYGCTDKVSQTVPDTVFTELKEAYGTRSPIHMEDFYPYLQYCLWNPTIQLTDYLDVSEDLANRIRTVYKPEYNYQQLVEAIVSKQYTYTRIYRCLLHIMLNIRKDSMEKQLASGSMHYARLLALRKESSMLLRSLNETSTIPIINRLTDGIRLLEAKGDINGINLLEQDIASAHLYEQTIARNYHTPAVNEYTKGIILV